MYKSLPAYLMGGPEVRPVVYCPSSQPGKRTSSVPRFPRSTVEENHCSMTRACERFRCNLSPKYHFRFCIPLVHP